MENFIEFPVFDGVSRDLRQWISWLEDFFVRERFTEDEKMNLAQSLLEGEANAWFYSSRKRFAFQSWEHLVVELLLWRFGYFGDGGVFSDLELFLLWNKYDRILRKRRKRMTTTSIPEKNLNLTASRETTDSTLATKSIQEAISESVLDGDALIEKDESYEATMVKVEDDTTMFQVSDSLEEESIHQNQVPVSSLEPSLSFSSEPLDVSASWPCAIVSNNPVHSQSGFESVKNMNNAYQVFDKTSPHTERLKPKTKKKLSSLSLKTWKFKFKNKNLQHNWSQMDLHQVIDRSKVNHLLCFSANFGLVRNRRTFQCLRLKKQAHKSRVLYQLRWLHDPGGKKVEHSDDIFETEVDMDNVQRTPMDTVAVSVTTTPDTVASSSNVVAPSTDVITERQRWDEACDAEIDALEGTGTYIVTSLPATKIPIGCKWLLQLILDDLKSHLRHKWKFEVAAYSFSFDVDTEENISSGLSPTSQVWEPGGVLASVTVTDSLGEKASYTEMVFDRNYGLLVNAKMRKLHKIDLQWARRKDWAELCVGHGLLVSWCGWMVFDRGKNKLILRDVTSEVIEALAQHCPQLTDLGFLDCLNHAMRGSNTSSHNLVHLMWHFKSATHPAFSADSSSSFYTSPTENIDCAVQNLYRPKSSRPDCTCCGQTDHVIYQVQFSVPALLEEELLVSEAVLGSVAA